MKDVYTLTDLRKWNTSAADEQPPIRLGVIGDPVAHSLSPQMMNAALREARLDLQYARFQIAPNELAEALEFFRAVDFVGLNVTVPHKIAVCALMDEVDDFATRVGAVNCVRFDNQILSGSNTDGPGFARAIRSEFSVDLRDLRVLLLGAGGGAGRAIARQCALEGCERLVLVNRTFSKAQQLAAELRPYFQEARVLGPVAKLEAIEWQENALRFQIANSDLVVNASSLGLGRHDPPPLPMTLLTPHLMIFDTVYGSVRTPLIAQAEAAGACGANGLSMLLQQGALAFEKWFAREAPLAAMRAAL